MDILRFVNSDAIREHLKKIDYQFEQNEIAWLIWQCNSISFDEKKTAWHQLMAEYEDTILQERCNFEETSLFAMIRKFIKLRDQSYQKFLEQGEKAVYSYEFYCPGDMSFCEEFGSIYSSLERCRAAIREDMDLGMTRIIIRKQYVDSEYGRIDIEYKQDLNGNWVVYEISSYVLSQEELQLDNFFEEMYFEFPVPFVKGDILYLPQKDSPYFEIEKSAFVFDQIAYEAYNDYVRQSGDCSDMRAFGYFPDDEGLIDSDGIGNYMNLEYYTKPLEGTQLIAKPVSSYLKGEINISLLLVACRKFFLENAAKEYVSQMYLEETRIKAGILPEKEGEGK